MKYFYDTEFLEDGKTVDLISIGIVAEDGREYYAVSSEVNDDELKTRIRRHDWLLKNVVPSLPLTNAGVWSFTPPSNEPDMFSLDMRNTLVRPRWLIANEVREFFAQDTSPVELWADYAAYDHVVLCQLWGTMMALPKGMPMWTHDLEQAWEDAGRPDRPEQNAGQHNALEDARWNAKLYQACIAGEAR
jgi:hypothetical protein